MKSSEAPDSKAEASGINKAACVYCSPSCLSCLLQ